ncbi:polymorphic toxin-type HINT domain-containing protein [Streptomyces sp. SPB162]|uniref:polymorphic toxin-type HINT domain-containing protein n=1 Tax=Streptomyces sp. SPB162 TaxID=2940560 RepID=UPI002405B350|nr:polymorphic toxin-type HINT domain-containing protein [Streptomyces sp. SPB162]MDF9815748.1 hypothetical protein [Streptomyces sp. SPB162]
MLATTALATATAVIVTGTPAQALPAQPGSALTQSATAFDAAHAAQVREAQCRLGYVTRVGGTEARAVARTGLRGSDAELLQAVVQGDDAPLGVASVKDATVHTAKGEEISLRSWAWKDSLTPFRLPTYTGDSFWMAPVNLDIFEKIGLPKWIFGGAYHWTGYFNEDLAPRAGAGTWETIRTAVESRYAPGTAPYRTFYDSMSNAGGNFGNVYADDARMFYQSGGFPDSAPASDSMEFRTDVEALKARFASCTSHNPLDPNGVLGAEVETASLEWQAEQAGQSIQRDTILGAYSQATSDLGVAAQAMGESVGQSLIAGLLTEWQAYWLKQPTSAGDYPSAAAFAQAKVNIAQAQARALGRVYVAARAAQSAKVQADKVTAAQTASYAISDTAGLPRGRGLMYAQQAAQVTKAAAAGALAAAKATETAANAARASANDSKALNSLAQTQAHATKAEFRRVAAQEAAAQAKAAADGAALQAAKAAANATKAKAAQAKAEAAETTAKNAAADAHAKRLTAEAERNTAKAQKELAESERAKAGAAEQVAQSQRTAAANALSAAQTAGATATTQMNAAAAAEGKASTARDNALSAERTQDTSGAKADAAEAYAYAMEGTDAAAGARTAATAARTAANDATTAAAGARTAATDATTAASNARQAATRATAAAARAKAASDGAQRDVAITNAAVTKAHAAAADAITASAAAAENVRLAKIYADTAKSLAITAKADAAIAHAEATAATADAVRTAGFAYASSQAALAARDSAAQVINPANDAIELGSPYKETDASAGLAVLVGQAAKTTAQQQEALAKAKADQAAKAATEAAALAAAATADDKAAATAAAEAASSAVRAAASLTQARGSAAEAATAANAAVTAETHTVAYNQQATDDAAAASAASDTAGGYASQARSAATDAERDAASARGAATAAEGDASTARGIATQAEADATTAEASAEHARELAEEAQQAATRTETAQAQNTLTTGGATGVGRMFTEQKITYLEEPAPQNDCVIGVGFGGCDVQYKLYFTVTVEFYVCRDPDAGTDVSRATCPVESITWLGVRTTPPQTRFVNKHFSNWEIVSTVDKAVLKAVWEGFTSDFIECSKGSVASCAWAASWFIPDAAFVRAADLLRSLDAAMRTGIGIGDAFKALKALNLDAKAIAAIEVEVNLVEEAFAACTRNSFPGGTQVLMADGSHRPIREVRAGDLLRSTDPDTGELRAEPVTATFAHHTERLMDIALTKGGWLTSTAGHRIYVIQRGWTFASDLRAGDLLRASDGSIRAVSGVRDRDGIASRTVYDLTVDGPHTFYARTGGARPQDLLVHNCTNLIADEAKFPDVAHTLSEHVSPSPEDLIKLVDKKGINTVYTDAELAQSVVDYGMQEFLKLQKNVKKLTNWVAKNDGSLLEIRGVYGKVESLGTAYVKNAAARPAGNQYVIKLQVMRGHKPGGYIVATSYAAG